MPLSTEFYETRVAGRATLGSSSRDYERAMSLIEAGSVSIKVRKAPYHSVSGAEGLSRAVSWLIMAGMATHDQMSDGATLPVTLTPKGRRHFEASKA